MDNEQIFMLMVRKMVEQTKIQQEMHQDLQKQNNKLLERLTSTTLSSVNYKDTRYVTRQTPIETTIFKLVINQKQGERHARHSDLIFQ